MLAGAVAIGFSGCSSPSAVNIELRKKNQALQSQVDQLIAQHQRDAAALTASEKQHPTTRTLGPDQLDQLVTTHGLSFGRLTGGDNPDSTKPFDNQLKVYVVPTDGDGVPIKAAGGFKVELLDLARNDAPLVGTWIFDPQQVRELFYDRFALYTYVLSCPWQTMPSHSDLTVRVTFDDLLTGREFVDQTQVRIRPPTTRP